MITRLSVKWESLFKFFFPVIGWKLNLTTDIFFLYKTDKTFVTLLSKKKQWLLPMMWFPHKNRLYCRANALHRIMSLQDFYSHKRDLPGPPNIQTITEGKYLGGGPTSLQNRAHWRVSANKCGVPMMLCRHNYLRMRLQKLTASFSLFKNWIDEFPNGSCKILLCICLETMEIQLEQLVLFESGEMLFSLVKSKDCVCISTEREVFFHKLTLNTWSGAIFYNKKTKSAPWKKFIHI